MSRIKVGVLRGGPSSEFEISLKSGETVLRNLSEEKYSAEEVFIDRKGVWHVGGVPFEPEHATKRFDVLFNALHGAYGEDGRIQRLLGSLGVSYTGSGTLGSSLAMNKAKAKEFFKKAGLKTASHAVLRPDGDVFEIERDGKREKYYLLDLPQVAKELFLTFPQPAVVKPLSGGSSVGIGIAYGAGELTSALGSLLEEGSDVILEEFIKGREATCGVVEGFRGEDVYSLLPVEIIPPQENKFFDYDAKYSGKSQEICPARFDDDIKGNLMEGARLAHEILGLAHYSRSDFIVTPGGSIYILETNTLPGLTEESLLPKSIAAVGSNLRDFLDHLIGLALGKK